MTSGQALSSRKLSGKMKFLLFTLGLYAVVSLYDSTITLNALKYFGAMLAKVLPVLGVVFVVLFITNIFLNPERIRKHLGTESGLRGWLYAIIGGIVISGPPYVLYPMLGELKKHGARNALLGTMLYNRNVKIHFIPAIIFYFGLRYTLVLSCYILVFSLLNGKLLELLVDGSKGQKAEK